MGDDIEPGHAVKSSLQLTLGTRRAKWPKSPVKSAT